VRLTLPWHGRRLALIAAVAVVAMLAGGLTAVQIRAAQADERRDSLAAQQATDRAEAQRRAEQEAARVERVQLVLSWATAAEQAGAAAAAADVALVASAGKVADDAIRLALAAAVEELRAAVADPPADPSDGDVAALDALTGQVLAASTAVTDAQAAWQVQQDAAAAAAAAAASAPSPESLRWPNAGAGPDCGSAQSYEPSKGGTVFHTSTPAVEGDGTNGNVTRSAMTALTWCADSVGNQQWLRTDAAEAMVRLNAAFSAEFGENIAIDLSYRSYADQVAIRAALGSIAARPGTSNHGWGLAIDTWEWAAYDFGSARFDWLVANGPAYGWVCPAATEPGNPEYWHYEYTG
jgi:hypothetical protein